MRVGALCLFAVVLGSYGCHRSCEEIDREARRAIDENAGCEVDEDCFPILVAFSCVPGIECWSSVNAASRTDQIAEAIEAANDERRANGCGCSQPRCDPAAPPVACVAGRCETAP